MTAIVDSGADVTHLPAAAAHGLGLDISSGRRVDIQTAGGICQATRLRVSIDVFNTTVSTHADFSENPIPLLGRTTLFSPELLDVLGITPGFLLLQSSPLVRLLAMRSQGLSEPEIDLWIAVFTSDPAGVEAALAQGANVNSRPWLR